MSNCFMNSYKRNIPLYLLLHFEAWIDDSVMNVVV
jgi:hypothetical protein